MSKKESIKTEEVKEEQKAETSKTFVTVGRIVHFWKTLNKQNGTRELIPMAGIVAHVLEPGENNMQAKDHAIHIVCWSRPNLYMENKFNVMYSEVPTEGRWSFPAKV